MRTHDFVDHELGKYANAGGVSVGTDHVTAEFAVETIRRWWLDMGNGPYPNARELLMTADGDGSNGYRLRLWKVAWQGFANTTGLTVRVCPFPPGTSKWNKDRRTDQRSVTLRSREENTAGLFIMKSNVKNGLTYLGADQKPCTEPRASR